MDFSLNNTTFTFTKLSYMFSFQTIKRYFIDYKGDLEFLKMSLNIKNTDKFELLAQIIILRANVSAKKNKNN